MSPCVLTLRPGRAVARGLAVLALLSGLGLEAQAAIFGDDEARRAILDLRQRLDTLQRRQAEEADRSSQAQAQALSQAQARLAEDNAQLRRSLLELSNQIEQLRAELSRLRGQDEQLARDISEGQRQLAEVQRRLRDVSNGVEDRLRQMEPTKVSVDGREFLAGPTEVSDFEAALAIMRRGEFAQAQTAFTSFVRRHPASGYLPSALFWLGNAQYATRNYAESLSSLRRMLAEAPDHARAPEAMLAVANAQLELKEARPTVRRTLDDLVKKYPESEAATIAKERLSKLK